MVRFEYKIATFHVRECVPSGKLLPALQKWGDEGWELVTIVRTTESFERIYFKRRID
jgi:hypothetical protein